MSLIAVYLQQHLPVEEVPPMARSFASCFVLPIIIATRIWAAASEKLADGFAWRRLKSVAGMLVVLLCLWGFGLELCAAQAPSMPPVKPSDPPTTWWPDPSTGLMWTGQSSIIMGRKGEMNLGEANSYCASLTLAGAKGWRLPALNEMRSAEYFYPVTYTDQQGIQQTYDVLAMKGGISTAQLTHIWTTTQADDRTVWSVFMGPPDVFGMVFKGQVKAMLNPSRNEAHERASKVTDKNYALCVRPMEADLASLAKDAEVNIPVPDLLTLKANVPLNKARQAFIAGRYPEAIVQAQNALQVKPEWADAYWAIGISYGMQNQWEAAISNLKSALKIDKNYDAAKDALDWAQKSQKNQPKGKKVKAKPPEWK
jgi:hypothetical protein